MKFITVPPTKNDVLRMKKIINNFSNFSDKSEYYIYLTKELIQMELLPKNTEIIFTKDLQKKILEYPDEKITNKTELNGISIIICHNDKNIILSKELYANSPQAIVSQCIYLYAINKIDINFKVNIEYDVYGSFYNYIKVIFQSFVKTIVAQRLITQLLSTFWFPAKDITPNIDELKRAVFKSHNEYQKNKDLFEFWKNVSQEFNFFITQLLEAHCSTTKLTNFELQEFESVLPVFLEKIIEQADFFLQTKQVDYKILMRHANELLNICNINIKNMDENANNIHVEIIDTPKSLFKGTVLETQDRIVAFIDILGFTNIINEYEKNPLSNKLKELHNALQQSIEIGISKITELSQEEFSKNFEYRMFSDCICMSVPYIGFEGDFEQNLINFLQVVSSYQLLMLNRNFYVRGAIAIGNYYSDEHMIFSTALVNAVKLEKEAVNPIIVIEQKILDILSKSNNQQMIKFRKKFVLNKNNPKIVFLNFFDFLNILQDKKNLNLLKQKQIEQINFITNEISLSDNTDKEKILKKYDFLKSFIEWTLSYKKSKLFDLFGRYSISEHDGGVSTLPQIPNKKDIETDLGKFTDWKESFSDKLKTFTNLKGKTP